MMLPNSLLALAPTLPNPAPVMPKQPDSPALVTDVQVARWQAGDEAAFAILYERFAPLIEIRVRRHRIWHGLQSRFMAEDIVQEAWLRVVPAAKKTFTPRGEGSFLAYISAVADNTMVDLLRKVTAVKRGEGKDADQLIPEEGFEPSAEPGMGGFQTPTSAARCSELQELAEGILKERELLAWQLVELKGYTAEEAGLALDMTGSAVRGLLLRGRARLAVALDVKNPE